MFVIELIHKVDLSQIDPHTPAHLAFLNIDGRIER
jgi:hypothetical protein